MIGRHRGNRPCRHALPAGAQPETLDQLQPCQSARIQALTGDDALRVRLRDVGLREGQTVIMVKQAPLADPLEYCIQGAHISLRRAEARQVRIADVCFAPFVGRGWGRRGRFSPPSACCGPEARGADPAARCWPRPGRGFWRRWGFFARRSG